jgi:hypothetical protein
MGRELFPFRVVNKSPISKDLGFYPAGRGVLADRWGRAGLPPSPLKDVRKETGRARRVADSARSVLKNIEMFREGFALNDPIDKFVRKK